MVLGDMIFQLFNDFAPDTVAYITTLINPPVLQRVGLLPHSDGVCGTRGSPKNDGTGGSDLGNIDDEFNPNLIFLGNRAV